MTNQEFIKEVARLIQQSGYSDVLLPSVTLAQAILESGWGRSGLTVNGNALFGIKAGKSWGGKVYNCKTQECYDGVNYTTITDNFRAYNSWADSVIDHGSFLVNIGRYNNIVGNRDYVDVCNKLQQDGYATSPTYAKSLINLIEQYDLDEYDSMNGVAYDEQEVEQDDTSDDAEESDTSGKTVYTVKSGDNLTKIGKQFGVTVAQLVAENNIKNANLIYVGQKIVIPKQGTVQQTPAPATVRELRIGDEVNYIGSVHYKSSTSVAPINCKGGRARVSVISRGAAHPLHLIHTESGCTVYGWVDEKYCERV